MKNKEEEQLRKYLKSKSALIVTESSTDRTAWKKLLTELGIPITNFHNCSRMSEAIGLINSKRIDILFCSYIIEEQECFPLLEAHIEKYPDRADYFCYVVSEKNSLAIAATAVECDVDGVLVKPYNQQDLQDTITDSLISSMNMSKRTREYHSLLSDIRTKKLDDLEIRVDAFISEKPESPNGYFLRGLANRLKGDFEGAITSWELGLTKDSKHHKIMCSIFDTYIEMKEFKRSYNAAAVLTAGFPVNPVRIPNLIRSSLATENFNNLISFCKMIVDVDDDLSSIQKPIAAALAISGKKLLESSEASNDIVIEASKKAIELTSPQSEVYITALENLFELNKFVLITEYIDKIPSDELNLQMLSLELDVFNETQDSSLVFAKAQGLVKLNKLTPSIYKVLLSSGKKIEKSDQQLEDIYFEASKAFPEESDQFKHIIQ
jgi:CheY-like chemotaxis protein